jgi:hypothetical protein
MRYVVTFCLVALGSNARAQGVPCDPSNPLSPAVPCTYQIDDVALQAVPVSLKLQAQISQARLPVGDALFNKIIVQLMKGTEALCSESFSSVQVVGSVLNLNLGAGMVCQDGEPLDRVIATHNALALKVCIENATNCLKTIALGTVPYAMKATYALQSQTAHQANQASVAHYAERLSADRDLAFSGMVTTGYFDFHTPDQATLDAGLGTAYEPATVDGYIQWAPVSALTPAVMHVCAKDMVADTPALLDRLVLHADTTEATGIVSVGGNLMAGLTVIDGKLSVAGDTELASTTLILGDVTIGHAGGALCSGAACVEGYETLYVYGDMQVAGTISTFGDGGNFGVPGSMTVAQDGRVDGALSVAGSQTNPVLRVNPALQSVDIDGDLKIIDANGIPLLSVDASLGTVSIQGTTDIKGQLLAVQGIAGNGSQPLIVNDPDGAEIQGPLVIGATLNVPNALLVTTEKTTVSSSKVTISGALDVTNALTIEKSLEGTKDVRVHHNLTVGGGADVAGKLQVGGALSRFSGTSLLVADDLTVAGKLQAASAAVTGGWSVGGFLNVEGAATFGQTVVVQKKLVVKDEGVNLLEVTDNVTLVKNDLTVAGKLTVQGGLEGVGLQCKVVEGTKLYLGGNSGGETGSAQCTDGYLATGGGVAWLDASTLAGQCGSAVLIEGANRHAIALPTTDNGYMAKGYNANSIAVCMQARASCCRIQ